jgi:hypothetical protein
MRLSFLPGDLHLNKEDDGSYVVVAQGEEVLRTPQERRALAKFNTLRLQMEEQFPPRELSLEEKRNILKKWVTESRLALGHNSLRTPKKKIPTTRTFG